MNRTCSLSCLLACAISAPAQDAADARIKTVPVAGPIHMLMGIGGNVGVAVGDDGAFLIDDQFAPMAGQIKAAVAELTDEPVRFVVNTHWHGDHTGGNERFASAGAIIVAHANARRRMSVEQFMKAFGNKVPPAPEAARPKITFTDELTFHWNGDDVHVFHVPKAHTDGDVIVHFPKANVIHVGDVFFNGIYPFIDTGSGGSVAGMIAAADRLLTIVDEDTKIIPGHGPLGGREDLQTYRDLLSTVRERVAALVRAGKSIDEIVAAKPSAEWDAAWGAGFMKPEAWLRIVHESVSAELEAQKKRRVGAAPQPAQETRRPVGRVATGGA